MKDDTVDDGQNQSKSFGKQLLVIGASFFEDCSGQQVNLTCAMVKRIVKKKHEKTTYLGMAMNAVS
jgi:hypothetical protein